MFGIVSSCQSTKMPASEYIRSTKGAGVLLLAVTMISPSCHAVSTINDVQTQYDANGTTASFPWMVTLDGGVTIQTVQWFKQPSTLIAQRSGSTLTVSSIYSGRVQNPRNEAIDLQNFAKSDEGTYRCTVTLSDLTSLGDTADLIMSEKPENATLTYSTEGDNVTLICNSAGGIPSPSYIWIRDGIIIISTTSNTLVISPFEVDDVGNYSCIASNVAGNVTSNIIQLTLYGPGSVVILVLSCSLAAVILFECQAVFAAILVTTFMVANKLNNTKVMKDCASFGPVIGAVLAVVVIVIACVVGDIQQWDIIAIVVVTAVALCLSIVAAVLGFLRKKTNGSLLHYVSMGLEIFLGLMVTIAGIVIVIIIANGTGPDIVCVVVVAIGGVCSVGSSGTACWCTCTLWKKNETGKEKPGQPVGSQEDPPPQETEMQDGTIGSDL